MLMATLLPLDSAMPEAINILHAHSGYLASKLWGVFFFLFKAIRAKNLPKLS